MCRFWGQETVFGVRARAIGGQTEESGQKLTSVMAIHQHSQVGALVFIDSGS